MELKPGYKQTEAGVIPDDWQCQQLAEGIKLFSGQHVLAKDCNTEGKGVPYITGPSDFSNGAIEISKFTEKPTTICQAGDILLTVKGSGAGTIILSDGYYCISRQLMAARVSVWEPNFVYAVLRQDASLLSSAATGLIPGLSRGDILTRYLPLPPLPEQRAIAAALSDTDALLSSLDRLLAKKRDIKQAVIQQLLTGKQRLPGFSGEWEVKRLGDFGKCLRGVSYKGDTDLSSHDTDTTNRLLRSNNVYEAAINIKDVQYVDRERVSEHQKMQVNDVLICMANGSKELVGKAGIFKINDGYVYTFGAFMGCYRTLPQLADPAFMFFLFQTSQYRDYINNLLAGSSINNLKPSSIESLEFYVPLRLEQTAIAAVLSDMDAEIDALQQRRDKTRAIKQGMMQELLTGRTRLV